MDAESASEYTHKTNVCTMLGQRRRRWTSLPPTLVAHAAFAGDLHGSRYQQRYWQNDGSTSGQTLNHHSATTSFGGPLKELDSVSLPMEILPDASQPPPPHSLLFCVFYCNLRRPGYFLTNLFSNQPHAIL